MQQLLSKIYVTTEEPVVKGASVTTEATAIPGAPATTEVQNNSAEAQYNSASASDPVDAEAPAKILIPLEHCCIFTQPRAHLLQSPVQDTPKFSPAQEHICLIISLSRPTFRPCYLTDMQRDDVKRGNKGLTLTELALMILTSSTSHQHCTHYSVHTPHILRGNMYSHGYYVVT